MGSLRRGIQPRARLLLPSFSPLGRTAHRGRIWAYQFIAELNFVRESWTAPVDASRVHPMEDANVVAVEQVKGLLNRTRKGGADPLFVFDAGYDPVKLEQGLEGWPCQILVRLRAGRRFYADPSLAGPPAHTGRPPRHGPKIEVLGSEHLA